METYTKTKIWFIELIHLHLILPKELLKIKITLFFVFRTSLLNHKKFNEELHGFHSMTC